MLGSVLGMYEAKTPQSMKILGLPKVRAQVLLEYLAINQMRKWPEDDVVVLFGDLEETYAVHAGRNDTDKAPRSLHVAGPAHLSTMAALMRALLSTERRCAATVASMQGAGSSGCAGTTISGGSNRHGGSFSSRGGGAASSELEATDSGGGAGSNRHGGSFSSRGGGAASSELEATDSGGGAGSYGSKDAHSNCGGGFDGDEGLLEAAQANFDAQVFMRALRDPVVFKGLGMRQPLASFQPLTLEENKERIRPWEN
ncbi:hypothetical protein HYH03_007773 [Edaphochlamys debaryana]|uniref:Uncharacterized protein n=1 Tax=Edaphochlamys debaryana TaxID=47281 RepID=A0A835Y830_9CHLO|nr:hypothetical protein HYH03_007773 [Edaphochlamys debaryana]|eukprot:KAG2494135.1 hypothetical protein HYH03_007773 [Edaphochlamys debaryana]